MAPLLTAATCSTQPEAKTRCDHLGARSGSHGRTRFSLRYRTAEEKKEKKCCRGGDQVAFDCAHVGSVGQLGNFIPNLASTEDDLKAGWRHERDNIWSFQAVKEPSKQQDTWAFQLDSNTLLAGCNRNCQTWWGWRRKALSVTVTRRSKYKMSSQKKNSNEGATWTESVIYRLHTVQSKLWDHRPPSVLLMLTGRQFPFIFSTPLSS